VNYKFVEYNDRTDKMAALVEEELHKGGEWKIAFVSSRNINTLIIFEQIDTLIPKYDRTEAKATVTSDKPKAPVTID
jgi:hypothetical protein